MLIVLQAEFNVGTPTDLAFRPFGSQTIERIQHTDVLSICTDSIQTITLDPSVQASELLGNPHTRRKCRCQLLQQYRHIDLLLAMLLKTSIATDSDFQHEPVVLKTILGKGFQDLAILAFLGETTQTQTQIGE